MVPQPSLRKKEFDRVLLEAIDEAFSSLGESSKTAIYYHLETAFNIKKQEIPSRVADFSRALEQLFGLGAKHLEILFMKSLYAKVRGAREWASVEWVVPEMTFREYVRLMRQKFEGAKQGQVEMGVLANENEEFCRGAIENVSLGPDKGLDRLRFSRCVIVMVILGSFLASSFLRQAFPPAHSEPTSQIKVD